MAVWTSIMEFDLWVNLLQNTQKWDLKCLETILDPIQGISIANNSYTLRLINLDEDFRTKLLLLALKSEKIRICEG